MDQWTRRNGVMKFTRSSVNELARRKINSVIPVVDNTDLNRTESGAMVIETTQNILDDCVNAENEVENKVEKEVEREAEKEMEREVEKEVEEVEEEVEKEAEKEVEKEADKEVEKEVEIEKEVVEEEDVEIVNVERRKENGKDCGTEKVKNIEVETEGSQQKLINVQDHDDDVAIIVPSKRPKLSSSRRKTSVTKNGSSRPKRPSTSTGVICKTSPRPVEQLDMFTKEVVRRYESHGHASRLMNISQMAMTQCCGNQQLSAGNFSWRESLIVSSKG